jgi:ABC-2 type transport system permease protein
MTPFPMHEPETAPMRKPGQPRQPLWRQFAALWAFGLREYRLWQSYRVNQVLWVTNILVTTLLFFLLGLTIAGQAASHLGLAYGTNYMSFVVIGVTINISIITNLSDPFTRIQRSYFNGTMDFYLLSPMSIYTPLLGLMTRSVLDDYPRLFFTFGFGMLLFDATFNFASWPRALLFTVLFLAAGFGLGMLSASSFYLLDIKKGTEPCAGYIGYPFKNRAGSSTASSSLAIYFLERENGKGPEGVVFDVLFRTNI